MDIVVTGLAGLEGSTIIYNNKECREKLLKKYSKSFFGVFEKAMEDTDKAAELDVLFDSYLADGMAADGAEGGVLAALWRVLKANRLGGTYSQRNIPLLQQTVELCEMFELNPYRLHSPGCRVWLSGDPGRIIEAASACKMPYSIIGFTSRTVAVKRTDTEGESSLRRPEKDELGKINL
ncbi:MAG: hypothetical protein Q4E57_02750 [Eubacteriales bacterium]|nr:hypothetical protein [Eubacteriales bacterium]